MERYPDDHAVVAGLSFPMVDIRHWPMSKKTPGTWSGTIYALWSTYPAHPTSWWRQAKVNGSIKLGKYLLQIISRADLTSTARACTSFA
jgi:hypothetical protein